MLIPSALNNNLSLNKNLVSLLIKICDDASSIHYGIGYNFYVDISSYGRSKASIIQVPCLTLQDSTSIGNTFVLIGLVPCSSCIAIQASYGIAFEVRDYATRTSHSFRVCFGRFFTGEYNTIPSCTDVQEITESPAATTQYIFTEPSSYQSKPWYIGAMTFSFLVTP